MGTASTFMSLAIATLAFLYGAPPGQNPVGLGRLRVLLALSMIASGPGFLSVYRIEEEKLFSPLTAKSEEEKRKANPILRTQ